MKIEVKSNIDGKITSLLCKSDNAEWTIQVDSFCIRKQSDESNPGTIIEKYRDAKDKGEIEKADKYFSEKENIINNYVNGLNVSKLDKPDYLQVFSTSDKVRNKIIELLKVKIIDGLEDIRDYSHCFSKVKKDLSIKNSGGTTEEKAKNFTYNKPNDINSIENLWIIDDTIGAGTTIEIFLDNLLKNGLLKNETKIRAFILYNNLQDSINKGFSFADIKKQLGK